jgi:hypothetical protein
MKMPARSVIFVLLLVFGTLDASTLPASSASASVDAGGRNKCEQITITNCPELKYNHTMISDHHPMDINDANELVSAQTILSLGITYGRGESRVINVVISLAHTQPISTYLLSLTGGGVRQKFNRHSQECEREKRNTERQIAKRNKTASRSLMTGAQWSEEEAYILRIMLNLIIDVELKR